MAPRPKPLTARPRIKTAEDGARVQIREPTSNVAMPIRKTALMEKRV
jgi:hypothetical protein